MLRLITEVGREGQLRAKALEDPDRVLGQDRFWVSGRERLQV